MSTTDWTRRYLDLIGFAGQPRPDLDTLRQVARGHLGAVPFESITSVLRRHTTSRDTVPPLDTDAMLDEWVAGRSGGLCFEVTTMLSRLLREVGFDVHPVLGKISFPGSHQAVCVHLNDRRYMVDAGNGAPFYEPIPLDDVVEVRHAGLKYRFHPDPVDDVCIQDRWIDGEWKPFCRYDLSVPEADAREAAYQQHHLVGCSWVVDSVVLVRCRDDEVWSMRDGQLSHFTNDGKQVTPLDPEVDYPRLARDVFGMPNLPIADALRALV